MDISVAYKHIEKVIILSSRDKEVFESLVECISLKKNELLLEEGEICRYEYFILSGCLRSYYIDDSSIEHTTLFAIEGWWTGNLKSFVKNTPSTFFIQAQEKSDLLRISKTNMETIYEQIPQFERYFRILLQNRLLVTQDRVNNHLSVPASQRYIQFISKYPEIEQRVSLKHIASYLGITPTYLSRLRRMRMKGDFLH